MPRLFQHGYDIFNRSGAVELDCGNDALADPVIEIFKEDEDDQEFERQKSDEGEDFLSSSDSSGTPCMIESISALPCAGVRCSTIPSTIT